MLLVWAKGLVFGKLNDLPVQTSSWWGIHWGAWLRNENKKRIYHHYFRETAFVQWAIAAIELKTKKIIANPVLEKLAKDEAGRHIFLFDKVIDDADLFGSVRAHRAYIRQHLFRELHPSKKTELANAVVPVISMHIRRGDFLIGNQATPLIYFMHAVERIRHFIPGHIPITIFTDAQPGEIDEILSLPGVKLADAHSDIVDLLLMSRSKLIVQSQSSTFSYWATFLSEAVAIMPKGDWQEQIRGKEYEFPEIKWQPGDADTEALLEQTLRAYAATIT